MEELQDKFDVLSVEDIKDLLLFYINSNNKNLVLLLTYITDKSENDLAYLHLLGNYYSEIKNYEDMLTCFKKCVDKNYKPSIRTLIIHYANREEFNNMEVYITKLISVINDEIKNYEADEYENLDKANKEMLEMIKYAGYKYGKSNKLEDMANKLKVCVDNFYDVPSMSTLGNCYREMKNYPEMEKYYLKGIHNNCGISALNYGMYLRSINNFEEMIRCYNIAIEHKNKNTFYEFYDYYKSIGNQEKVDKYFDLVVKDDELMPKYYDINVATGTLFRK